MFEFIPSEAIHFFVRFSLAILTSVFILGVIYTRKPTQRENINAFFLFSSGVFLVTYLLHNVQMSMGFAFGLFAVFSMLRYRTETLTVRDMTYLFIVITTSLLSAVSNLSFLGLLLINALICIIARASEYREKETLKLKDKLIIYDVIDNIKPENKEALIEDLKTRTGLHIHNVEIMEIDFLKDIANINITFIDTLNNNNQ